MQFSSSFSLQDWGSYMKGAWVLRRAWKIYQRTYTDIRRLYIKCVGLGGNSIGKWETFQAAYFVTILVVFWLNWTIFLRAIEVNQLFRSADRKNMNASKYGKRPKKKEVRRTMPFRRCPIWHAVLAFLPIRRVKMDTRSFRPLSFHSRNNSLLRIFAKLFFLQTLLQKLFLDHLLPSEKRHTPPLFQLLMASKL